MIVGLVLAILAVIGFFVMRGMRGDVIAVVGTDALTVSELEVLRGASDEVGVKGGFRKPAEVVGAAYPRPEGVLVSELSKTECVWYHYRVDRKYEQIGSRGGEPVRHEGIEKVSEHTSWEGYALRDAEGRLIGVDPNGTHPDHPEVVLDRFETSHQPNLFDVLVPRGPEGRTTIGYRYREWVIRPGQRLFVLGEVHDKIGPLVIGKPEGGNRFIISTRSKEEVRKDRVRVHTVLKVAVLLIGPIGVLLAVLGGVLH